MLLHALVSACCLTQPTPPAAERRARVWSEVAAINERSIRSLHVHENTDLVDNGTARTEYASRDMRINELGEARVEGSRWTRDADTGTVFHSIERLRTLDGITRSADIQQGYGVAYTAESIKTCFREEPTVFIGVGMFRPRNDLYSLYEFLLSCPSLRVISETEAIVTIQVIGSLSSQFKTPRIVQVDLGALTGDVDSIAIYDSTWGHLSAKYTTDDWRQFGTVRLPQRVSFQQYDLDIPKELKKQLEAEATRTGLGRDNRHPGDSRYEEWLQLRNRMIPPPTPSRLYSREMQGRTTIESVNATHDEWWLAFPPQTRLSQFLSGALDCPVDTFDVEPSDGYLGPKPRE